MDVALSAGILGLLSRDDLQRLADESYSVSPFYLGEAHNLSGLYEWERRAVVDHFAECRRLLLLGCGAGREMIALLQRGYEVLGFECNEALRTAGNGFLAQRGLDARIQPMAPDSVPPVSGQFDGAILGWGMLTHVQGRAVRHRLLSGLRYVVPRGAPLLVSFLMQEQEGRSGAAARRVASWLRRVLGREALEVGDGLLLAADKPMFVHLFSEEELKQELQRAGWDVVHFSGGGYPHTVARAR